MLLRSVSGLALGEFQKIAPEIISEYINVAPTQIIKFATPLI